MCMSTGLGQTGNSVRGQLSLCAGDTSSLGGRGGEGEGLAIQSEKGFNQPPPPSNLDLPQHVCICVQPSLALIVV